VLRRPPLFPIPRLPPGFVGAADIRGRSVPILDLGSAVRYPERHLDPPYLVVTEFNRSVQGFLVAEVDRIVNIAVEDIRPPPELGVDDSYLTAVTRYGGELIQVIDVESVLADATGAKMLQSIEQRLKLGNGEEPVRILVTDDSRVARNQIRGVLDQLGVSSTLLSDGRQAIEHLKQLAAEGIDVTRHYAMVISDIEMPSMDGYTLTTEIRRDPALAGLFVLLHTSLSGVFNNAMVDQVGANAFVAKYSANELAEKVLARVQAFQREKAAA
jgi:two-component system chemotaxis response regulator CheV